MEVVVEVVNRGGRMLERHRVGGTRLTIGRAYDNDVIISDETVCPHHAVISTDEEGGLVITDLDSVNGTRIEGREISGLSRFESGDECSLGRARVRIYSARHPVADTLRIGGMDGVINRLGKISTVMLLLGVVCLATLAEIWLNSSAGIVWQQVGLGLFSVTIASAVIAMFFAIIGRIAKHEGRFATQFSVVLAYLLVQSLIVYVYELILFNTLSPIFSIVLGLGFSYILLCNTLRLNLHIATSLDNGQRWKFALAFSTILLCISVYPEIVDRTEFSSSPRYVKEIKPPMLRFRGGVARDEFLAGASVLYDKTHE